MFVNNSPSWRWLDFTEKVKNLAMAKEKGPNRLRPIRKARGETLEVVAARAGTSAQQLSRWEKNERGLKVETLPGLAVALDASPGDLVDDQISVRTRYVIGRFESEARPPPRIPLPLGFADPSCFACYIADDSADRLYQPGSFVIARPIAGPLKQGDRVVVRRKLAHGVTDILVGMIFRGPTGDLEVSLRSDNAALRGASVTIRRGVDSAQLSERVVAYVPAPNTPIMYQPEPGDEAELLGKIIRALSVEAVDELPATNTAHKIPGSRAKAAPRLADSQSSKAAPKRRRR